MVSKPRSSKINKSHMAYGGFNGTFSSKRGSSKNHLLMPRNDSQSQRYGTSTRTDWISILFNKQYHSAMHGPNRPNRMVPCWRYVIKTRWTPGPRAPVRPQHQAPGSESSSLALPRFRRVHPLCGSIKDQAPVRRCVRVFPQECLSVLLPRRPSVVQRARWWFQHGVVCTENRFSCKPSLRSEWHS